MNIPCYFLPYYSPLPLYNAGHKYFFPPLFLNKCMLPLFFRLPLYNVGHTHFFPPLFLNTCTLPPLFRLPLYNVNHKYLFPPIFLNKCIFHPFSGPSCVLGAGGCSSHGPCLFLPTTTRRTCRRCCQSQRAVWLSFKVCVHGFVLNAL